VLVPRSLAIVIWAAAVSACGASSSIDGDHLYTRIACDAGTADCDGRLSTGCETDVTTRTDCGGCGVTCGDGQICATGTCMSP
jgi:hypothetical protein